MEYTGLPRDSYAKKLGNKKKRAYIARDVLERHPYASNIWISEYTGEITADFELLNPETDIMEGMLGLERYGTWVTDRELADGSPPMVTRVGWDCIDEYHYLSKDGVEVPFTEWSDGYEWDIPSYLKTHKQFIAKHVPIAKEYLW